MDLEVLGERVRDLRLERGLTLNGLAERCDVSVSMLSSVERGEKAATVVVLDRIAGGLGTPLTDLLTGQLDRGVVVRRAADQDVADEPGGWRRVILTPVVPGVNFEWIRSTLPPGCDAGTFPAYAPGSHEFIAVEEGELTMTVGTERLVLTAGDSLYFAADVPHGFANDGGTDCSYHVAALNMRSRKPGRR
ncbi:XRE family transcriptional regulator [Actinomycetes bacterium KLBMP 9759]